MIDFFLPTGSPNMSDVMVTLSTIIGGLVMYRQKAKDQQIAILNEQITNLRQEIQRLEKDLEDCFVKRRELFDSYVTSKN